jgi:hypothetical protein
MSLSLSMSTHNGLFCCAAGYSGQFYNANRQPLGSFNNGYPQITDTTIINNNNINIVNNVPQRQVTNYKQDPSTIAGQQGVCASPDPYQVFKRIICWSR